MRIAALGFAIVLFVGQFTHAQPSLVEPIKAPSGVKKPEPNQRWRFVTTPSTNKFSEYIIEWYDAKADNWSGRALTFQDDGQVTLNPLDKKAPTQRWIVERVVGDNRALICEPRKFALGYQPQGDSKFRAIATPKDGGKRQEWMVLRTPTAGELGIWNRFTGSYLAFNADNNVVELQSTR